MVPSELMNSTKNEWGSGQHGLGVNSVSLGRSVLLGHPRLE